MSDNPQPSGSSRWMQRLRRPAAPRASEVPAGLERWEDPFYPPNKAASAAAVEREMRIPLWLLVTVLSVWIGILLVTAAWLVVYAASPPPGSTTAAAAARPSATLAPSATLTQAATSRPTAASTATPSPTPPPTIEPTRVPTEAPTAAEAATDTPAEGLPTEEPTAEPLPSATPAPTLTPSPTALPNPHEAHLTGVVDGGTIEVEFGGAQYRVRLLGILVPNADSDDPRIAEAGRRAEALTTLLVQGTPLLLERDVSDADEGGALLRYVWADGRNVALELVRQGLATVRINNIDTRYQDDMYAAQLAAQNECLGLWTCP